MRLSTPFRVLVTAALIVYIATLVDADRLVTELRRADLRLLLAAVAVALADRLFMIVKWLPLLRVQRPDASLRRAARAYLASGLANYLLPASVGADVSRAAALGRGDRRIVEVGASVVAERVLGMIGLSLMTIVSLVIALQASIPTQVIVLWCLAAVAVSIAALVLPTSPRVGEWLRRFGGARRGTRWWSLAERFRVAYEQYRRHVPMLCGVVLLSFVEQILPIVGAWLVAASLGLSIGFKALIVAVPLTCFVGRLPVSLGGLGVGEGAMLYLLALHGVPASDAVALQLAGRAVELVVLGVPTVVLWRDLVGGARVTPAAPPESTAVAHSGSRA